MATGMPPAGSNPAPVLATTAPVTIHPTSPSFHEVLADEARVRDTSSREPGRFALHAQSGRLPGPTGNPHFSGYGPPVHSRFHNAHLLLL